MLILSNLKIPLKQQSNITVHVNRSPIVGCFLFVSNYPIGMDMQIAES